MGPHKRTTLYSFRGPISVNKNISFNEDTSFCPVGVHNREVPLRNLRETIMHIPHHRSFGVLLLEIITFAALPLEGIAYQEIIEMAQKSSLQHKR